MLVNVVQRKDNGKYRVKVRAKDESGQWVTKWIPGSFSTRTEAEVIKSQIAANAARGNIETLDRASVGAYCAEWLAMRQAMGQIEASSAAAYRSNLRRVLDILGAVPLATLSSKDIQAAYAKIVMQVGAAAARQSHIAFRLAIRDALKTGRLLADPFIRVEAPRAKTVRKQTTLTAEQVAALVAAHRGTELGLMLELMAVTGLRTGEATALQWQDFDFARGKLRVERNMARGPQGGYLKAPKTEAGRRTISVPADTMARFRARAGREGEFVFTQHSINSGRAWGRRVAAALRNAGLGQFTPHDLRHAHATFLLKHTPNPKIVSKRLGHSDVRITLSVYSHVLDGDDEELGDLAANLTGDSNG